MPIEVNVFIDEGTGHIKYVMPSVREVQQYDDEGKEVVIEREPTPEEAVAVFHMMVEAVKSAGHELGREKPRYVGKSAPKEEAKPPDGVPVPVHCGQPAEFKAAWTNKNGTKIGAKFQCRNDNCPDKLVGGYKWSVFLDKWMAAQGGNA